jgi:hypothetical protein
VAHRHDHHPEFVLLYVFLHVGFSNAMPSLELVLAFEPNSEILFGSNAFVNQFFSIVSSEIISLSPLFQDPSPAPADVKREMNKVSCLPLYSYPCLIPNAGQRSVQDSAQVEQRNHNIGLFSRGGLSRFRPLISPLKYLQTRPKKLTAKKPAAKENKAKKKDNTVSETT